jgi:hypothetical protein
MQSMPLAHVAARRDTSRTTVSAPLVRQAAMQRQAQRNAHNAPLGSLQHRRHQAVAQHVRQTRLHWVTTQAVPATAGAQERGQAHAANAPSLAPLMHNRTKATQLANATMGMRQNRARAMQQATLLAGVAAAILIRTAQHLRAQHVRLTLRCLATIRDANATADAAAAGLTRAQAAITHPQHQRWSLRPT